MSSSRISGFYKLSVTDRLKVLYDRGHISEADYTALLDGEHLLTAEAADRLVENVIGSFSLPWGLGLNFLVNDREHVVPLVVEEPSIIAAVSGAAKIVRESGGFSVTSDEPRLIGQVQVVDLSHASRAQQAVLQSKEEIVNLANSLHPRLVGRGGGVRDVEAVIHSGASEQGDMLVVNLIVDTRDAMGANAVNSMCEGVAPLIEKLTSGKVFLRILSNLTDRAMVCAECRIPPEPLGNKDYHGEQVRDGIVLASDLAAVDAYRAATHNKGIMNGIDAVAIATGNDWRAIEAAAHAYAGRGDRYTSLTKWHKDDDGALVGRIEIPLKVGTVGGQVESNPSVGIALRLMGVSSARELAEVMGAVGLAQNLAALRALSTEGIQAGHMTLHARSVAVAAGATAGNFEAVVERLVDSGEIKVWKAKEIIGELEERAREHVEPSASDRHYEDYASGYGKIILMGEHAVVYDRHALAAPIPLAVKARVERLDRGAELIIPRWGVELNLRDSEESHTSLHRSLDLILTRLGVRDEHMRIEVYPHVPRAMGLGGSAALAVAVIRAVAGFFDLSLTEDDVNSLAYECERFAHGTPSGIDNTLATYGEFILFKKDEPPTMREIEVPKPIPMVIGLSGVESLTAKMVGRVREAWQRNPDRYERIFAQIDDLTQQAVKAVQDFDLAELGELMNLGQGLLNALQVSSWELEELIQIARANGALGAKLTGGGGGGSIIALAPDNQQRVARAMREAGYRALITEFG